MTDLNPVKVTHTVVFSPKDYLKWCSSNNANPSQENFRNISREWFLNTLTFGNAQPEVSELSLEDVFRDKLLRLMSLRESLDNIEIPENLRKELDRLDEIEPLL